MRKATTEFISASARRAGAKASDRSSPCHTVLGLKPLEQRPTPVSLSLEPLHLFPR